MAQERQQWVVKAGSSVITATKTGLDSPTLHSLADQIGKLRQRGIDVQLVSSGAVALGMTRVGATTRPRDLNTLQALAALGQADLVARWRSALSGHNLDAALVLLTRWDTEDRGHYLNIRNTLNKLRQFKVVPIINENDSVATHELQFGDNDILAGLVVNIVSADRLVVLTDQNGLYDKDPSLYPDATLVNEAQVTDSQLDSIATPAVNRLGSGGMQSKLKAARLAARSGADCWILNGMQSDILLKLADGEQPGTHLCCHSKSRTARQRWLAGRSDTRGQLHLDEGAAHAILKRGASLLPVGVLRVQGNFQSGDLVSCHRPDGLEIAIGLVNYGSINSNLIAGKRSTELPKLLGYLSSEEMIHRNNMFILRSNKD